jgi:hypothetical protein
MGFFVSFIYTHGLDLLGSNFVAVVLSLMVAAITYFGPYYLLKKKTRL